MVLILNYQKIQQQKKWNPSRNSDRLHLLHLDFTNIYIYIKQFQSQGLLILQRLSLSKEIDYLKIIYSALRLFKKDKRSSHTDCSMKGTLIGKINYSQSKDLN